jgi:hypothetical protein
MKLIQKSFLNGTREFELLDDVVNVRIKKFFKEQKNTVGLVILNPEPVVNGPYLEFHDRYKDHQLLSLVLNKPNAEEFNAFVYALKQKALGKEKSRSDVLDGNVYEEPPEFAKFDDTREKVNFKPVNSERIESNITMLKTYLNEDDIKPLLDTLETLKVEPDNEAAFMKMVDTFKELGINQGAVLTYAPYLKVLLSQHI